MIAEVLTRKISRPFKGLADYLNGRPDRVETSFFLNCSCDNYDLSLKEIKIQQELSKSTSDKTYHFVISLREGEKLNNEQIEKAAKTQLKVLGFEKHQALVTAHNDTSNFHIHVGVNKVCPETGRIVSPYNDYQKLDKTCAKLEKLFGLAQDNRMGKGTNTVKRLYDGRQSFQEWVKELTPEIMDRWKEAENWKEFHTGLAEFNLCIRQRGAGFVISDLDEKLFMKASSVDRKLSKKNLEGIFGPYESINFDSLPVPDKKYEGIPKGVKKDSPLFTEFLEGEKAKRKDRNRDLTFIFDQHSERVSSLKQWYYDCKQEIKKDWFMAKRERVMVMNRHRQTMKEILDEYYQDLQKQKQAIMRETSPAGWNTFILKEAHKGRMDALNVLRNKKKNAPFFENSFSILKSSKLIVPGFNKVSRHGEFIYHFGKVELRDTGNNLKFFGDFSDEKGLINALKLVSTNNSKSLIINGPHSIKRKVSNIVHENKINLSFTNFKVQQGRGGLPQGQGR